MNYSDIYKENYRLEKYLVEARIKNLSKLNLFSDEINVLEIGIGLKSFSQSFDNFKNWDILEPNEEFVKSFLIYNKDSRVNIINSPLEKSIVLKKYDLIIVSGLVHMIIDLKTFYFKLKEFSDPKTLIYLNVPNSISIHRQIALKMGIIDNVNELSKLDILYGHQRVYSMELLVESLKECFDVQIMGKGSYYLKFLSNSQYLDLLNSEIVNDSFFESLVDLSESLCESNMHGSEIFLLFKFELDL